MPRSLSRQELITLSNGRFVSFRLQRTKVVTILTSRALPKQPEQLIDLARNPSHKAAPLYRKQVGSRQYAWMTPSEAARYNKTLDQYAEDHRKKYGKPTEIDPRSEDSSAEVASFSTSVSAAESTNVTTSNRTGSSSNPPTETVNSDYWMLKPEGGWEPVQGK
jgi:hypothetical protein